MQGLCEMFKFFPFLKRKEPLRNIHDKICGPNVQKARDITENHLEIKIGDVLVKITRNSGIPLTNELTAVIPRAEIRRKLYYNGKLAAEEEIILSSITLVDSPLRQSNKT